MTALTWCRAFLKLQRLDGRGVAVSNPSFSKMRAMRAQQASAFDAEGLLSAYCRLLHQRYGTFEEVSQRTKLNWRTVKKYVTLSEVQPRTGS